MLNIPDPGFSGDDGAADPQVRQALADSVGADGVRTDGVTARRTALAMLLRSRLLVPVVAVLGEVEITAAGLKKEKTSDMATVLLTGNDGSTAMLGFTGTDSLQAWRADARPVAVTFAAAAQAAMHDGAAAIMIDVAGPVPFVVHGTDLEYAAQGLLLTQVGEEWVWVQLVSN